MLIRSAALENEGGDAYVALIEYLRNQTLAGNPFAIAALSGLVVGLVSIMMSTVDVAIIAATQSYVSDIRAGSNFRFASVLIFGICLTASVVGIAAFHVTQHSGVSILAVISGANAAIIGIAPAAIVRLANLNIANWSISLSILAGLLGSAIGTFGPVGNLPSNITIVLPIYCAIIPAALVLLGGLLIARLRGQKR